MMPNDINAICKSNDLVSGSARSQMLKDGSFAGPGLFAEDPETQQKNFLSLLSRLGNGTLQVVPEESKSVNLKPEQGRLTDEGNADNAFAGKPKEKLKKEGTEGNGVKRLPSSISGDRLAFCHGIYVTTGSTAISPVTAKLFFRLRALTMSRKMLLD